MSQFIRNFVLLSVAFALTACVAADSVELESRAIAMDQNAAPAGAAGQVASASVAQFLPSTGPTYVTLTVSQLQDNSGTSGSEKSRRAITSGSGFVVSTDGFVMTAAHVAVAKGNAISARAANGRVYLGRVVGINNMNDMAVVKLSGFTGNTVAPAGPGCMAKGDLVYTLGKPHGGGDTARVGAFESLHFGRPVTYGRFGYPDAMVLHMGTQRGESGGPVFDGKGRLIGMVVSTLSDTNGQSINLAHAIPATTIAGFLCGQTSCKGNWPALSTKQTDSCS